MQEMKYAGIKAFTEWYSEELLTIWKAEIETSPLWIDNMNSLVEPDDDINYLDVVELTLGVHRLNEYSITSLIKRHEF
jgi:hypothetical protein